MHLTKAFSTKKVAVITNCWNMLSQFSNLNMSFKPTKQKTPQIIFFTLILRLSQTKSRHDHDTRFLQKFCSYVHHLVIRPRFECCSGYSLCTFIYFKKSFCGIDIYFMCSVRLQYFCFIGGRISSLAGSYYFKHKQFCTICCLFLWACDFI